MRIAVVMDPLSTVDPDHDSTYVLMREAHRRGHEVHHVAPSGVEYRGGASRLRGRRLDLSTWPIAAGPMGEVERVDAVLIRTDPPFDADYLAVTQLLDLLPPGVFVMNRPRGLRDANEKLAALRFPELGPPTLISQDEAAIEAFRVEVGGAMVVKPLDGHGGSGVFLVQGDDPNRRALVRGATRGGTAKVVAQGVVEGSEAGDVRVIVLGGEPIGAVLRRNDRGDFAHNLAIGGRAYKAEVGVAERRVCDAIAPWLRASGLYLAGIDLVGGKLIEVNVTSPTCLQEINRLDGVRLEAAVVDFIEGEVGRG